jgi:hypothetical protein
MRRWVAVLGLVAMVGCGSGDDASAACDEASAWREAQLALVSRIDAGGEDLFGDIESLQPARDKARAKLADEAPADVASALESLDNLDPDAAEGSERALLLEARSTITEWMVDECDLDAPPW